jgi:hypothetical protein
MAAYKGRGSGVIIKKLLNLYMTSIQVKTEIQKVLDQVPEEVLTDVLDFLKELQKQPAENIQLAKFMKQTLLEDKELLEKLAK